MKKRYTLIYQVNVGMGHYVIKVARVETDNLLREVARLDAQLVFEGWPESA